MAERVGRAAGHRVGGDLAAIPADLAEQMEAVGSQLAGQER